MQKEDIKFENSTVFEGMTSIRAIINGIDSKIHDRKIEKILFDKERLKKHAKEIGYLRAVKDKYGFDLIESNAEELEKMTLGTSHGGIVAICNKRALPCLDESTQLEENGFYAMIQGIEDPYNFGYSLRSLYAMGCTGIILDERNWMSAAGVVARSSAGASEKFLMYRSDPISAAKIFKTKGYKIVCADERTDKVLGKCDLKKPLLLIVGGEKRGISRELLSECDLLIKIDYRRDFNASLSAASAATMFAYEIARQNN